MLTEHTHPKSKAVLKGFRLVPGATLQDTDLHDSRSGRWEPCPAPGLTLENTRTIWVRPNTLSPDEMALLKTLAARRKGCFDCIAFNPGDIRRFVFVSSPSFNWDGRIQTSEVKNPGCIRPLLDVGFLTKIERRGVEYYVLTDSGRQAAQNQ